MSENENDTTANAEGGDNTSSADGDELGHGQSYGPGPDDGDRTYEPAATNGELYGVLAEYNSVTELVRAAEKVRDAGYEDWDCFVPFPLHGIDEAMGIKRTILPVIVFCAGTFGLVFGLALQWWANAWDWPWLVGGKPYWSIAANIPIGFETTVLLSAFGAFFGMWGLNKLPQPWHPLFRNDRFRKATDDGLFIGIEAADKKFEADKTVALLRDAGASWIEPCHIDPDPKKKKVPKPLVGFMIVTAALSLIPIALVAKARASKSRVPHWHIIPDMDFQFMGKSQTKSDVFQDGRTARYTPKGTVARGELKADDHFYRGISNGKWAESFPRALQIDEATAVRGQERFNVYCAPCHGVAGKGDGLVHQRATKVPNKGWLPPPDLTSDYIVKLPHGQLFQIISNGVRSMKGYRAQIPESDRWAIILYVRALQRSHLTKSDDVPSDKR